MAGKKRKATDEAKPNKRARGRRGHGQTAGVRTLTPNSVGPIDAASTSLTPNFVAPVDTAESTNNADQNTAGAGPVTTTSITETSGPTRIDFIAKIRPRRPTRSGGKFMVSSLSYSADGEPLKGKKALKPYVNLIADLDGLLRKNHEDVKEEHTVKGHFDIASNSIIFEEDRLVLARIIEQEGKQYYIAGPPVTKGRHRRVHFLLGVEDRKPYVRKLVKCTEKPTEAVYWPEHELISHLVSCEQIDNEEPYIENFLKDDEKIWSIISEYVPGQLLEWINKRIGNDQQIEDCVIWQFGHDALSFVQSLQAKEPAIAHKNLFPECVLVDQKDTGMPIFRFIDSGITTPVDDKKAKTSKPEYPLVGRWTDAEGVATCMLEMMSVGMDYRSGHAAEQMHNLYQNGKMDDERRTMYELVKNFHQTAYDHRWQTYDWSRHIKQFKDYAEEDLPEDRNVGRLVDETKEPSEPVSYGSRNSNGDNRQLVSGKNECFFFMGWYQEVWVDPVTFNFIGQPGILQYGDVVPGKDYTEKLA